MEGAKIMKLIKGDASSRKFFRDKKNKKSKIIILSSTNKKKNLLDYDAVNKILIKNKIRAPKLIYQNYEKNFIEVEDFGDETVFKIFQKCKINKQVKIYKKIVDELIKLQNIKTKNIKNFKSKNYVIPTYSHKILKKEVDLFFDWYVKYNFNNKQITNLTKKIRTSIYKFLKSFRLRNKVFVHRDFHISNLILQNEGICLIDNQDAVFGSPAYDLCSLVDDVRYETSNNIKNIIINYYLSKTKIKFSKKDFINDFVIHSIARNLKIIGIFTRLSVRDKKHHYLKLIPHAWKLIKNRLKNKDKFNNLKMQLNKL
tara:strand:+ start:3427 stop:4365 length:939 start_codon:yes stop_codon:yes gene_type:complete